MKKKEQKQISIDKIKNAIIILLVLVIVFGGSFFASQLNNNSSKKEEEASESVVESSTKAQEESASISEEEQKELTEIDVDRYLELKEGSEASIIYIARPTCQYCQIQEPIIRNIAYRHDLTIHYLNTDAMEDDDVSKFMKSDDYFKEGFGTPCTIVVKDDEILGKLEGLVDRDTMTDFFKTHGIISE